MPGDLAGVVRVHHGGRVHGTSPAPAAAPGSPAVAEEEEGGEEEQRGDGRGSSRPRPRHCKRECNRGLASSRRRPMEGGGGRGARRGAVTAVAELPGNGRHSPVATYRDRDREWGRRGGEIWAVQVARFVDPTADMHGRSVHARAAADMGSCEARTEKTCPRLRRQTEISAVKRYSDSGQIFVV
jgi:hypothetical protein